MIQLDPGTKITLKLTAADVQVILMGLGELQLKVAKPVDQKIEAQLLQAFAPKAKNAD